MLIWGVPRSSISNCVPPERRAMNFAVSGCICISPFAPVEHGDDDGRSADDHRGEPEQHEHAAARLHGERVSRIEDNLCSSSSSEPSLTTTYVARCAFSSCV